jgi:4-guanidinobutyraldehyde dehydrogenase / NAD-dependent aldehyde dehydrogenase
MTATTTPKTQPTAEDWIERARAINPRNDAFIDGRFVPAASGRTFDDIAGRDGQGYIQLKTTWFDLSNG